MRSLMTVSITEAEIRRTTSTGEDGQHTRLHDNAWLVMFRGEVEERYDGAITVYISDGSVVYAPAREDEVALVLRAELGNLLLKLAAARVDASSFNHWVSIRETIRTFRLLAYMDASEGAVPISAKEE